MAAIVVTATGCTQQQDAPAPLTAGSDAPLNLPAGPGEAGRTAAPGERLGESEARPTAADVTFAESMIPHHRQALEMAALAGDRTTDTAILALAERITVSQQPEIEAMSAWLTALGRPVPGAHAHEEMRGRYGMATLAQMNRLRAARGESFDRLFLELMIAHHRGALAMAKTEVAEGADRRMRLMARDVLSSQAIEISRMTRLAGGSTDG
ncbi:uncharacterized protein (DUF305 family) [Thermocatellispora tengchongensis]|uniref:Uncharacterized protein (DUF305 family) n=1 Tax=Thermocatellispora tengchongensis TaxID=1073253 RepID=A0A840PBW9_9ACTN|nr:DUF305 domain-containing protein [Thermocatellispora tengchongensis]MBB5136186.1 uncharacterized protein (DUF305 family) [Thermocatellispora tengchongensis]